jgi:hypothetical protein
VRALLIERDFLRTPVVVVSPHRSGHQHGHSRASEGDVRLYGIVVAAALMLHRDGRGSGFSGKRERTPAPSSGIPEQLDTKRRLC